MNSSTQTTKHRLTGTISELLIYQVDDPSLPDIRTHGSHLHSQHPSSDLIIKPSIINICYNHSVTDTLNPNNGLSMTSKDAPHHPRRAAPDDGMFVITNVFSSQHSCFRHKILVFWVRFMFALHDYCWL